MPPFKQRYVFDSTYYKPGGPVYLYISGETSVESRLSNLETGIIQILMNATGGAGRDHRKPLLRRQLSLHQPHDG